ncbi:MAG: hypothetical protein AAF127_13745 [Pseudomonadota bacterium]
MPNSTPPFARRVVPAGLHAFAAVLALGLTAFWPKAGGTAMLVPVGVRDFDRAIGWIDRNDAQLLGIAPSGANLIVSIPSHGSALNAFAHGFVPIAAGPRTCRPISSKQDLEQ